MITVVDGKPTALVLLATTEVNRRTHLSTNWNFLGCSFLSAYMGILASMIVRKILGVLNEGNFRGGLHTSIVQIRFFFLKVESLD